MAFINLENFAFITLNNAKSYLPKLDRNTIDNMINLDGKKFNKEKYHQKRQKGCFGKKNS